MKRFLKILCIIAVVILVLAGGVFVYTQVTWNRPVDRPALTMAAKHDSATIAKGKYIYTTTWLCWGCHTQRGTNVSDPPSGGQLFDLRSVGPGFGRFYSANITPDSATGIGAWTDGEIVQALREGVRRNRHLLFPIMPIEWLKGLSDDDALAIVSYLRTLPPVHNRVPDVEPSLVAKALFAFNLLKPMPRITEVQSAPPRGETLEYGRYLATNLSGCAECHTPFNVDNGQPFLDSLFTGGSFLFGEAEGDPIVSYAANLTTVLGKGKGRWSEGEFVAAVTSGMRPDGTVLDPHMPYPAYKQFNQEDLRALYLFFGSLDPIQRAVLPAHYASQVLASKGVERGELLFKARCSACHGAMGKGAPPTEVKLSEVASSIGDADLLDFVSSGQPGLKMPSFRKTLSHDEIQDVIAYIRTWKHE
jgi:mono/diheme cytochrome c family protein